MSWTAAAIESFYKSRGYASISVKSAANEIESASAGEGSIQPTIAIVEGPLIRVGEIGITGSSAFSEQELRQVIKLVPGDPYDQAAARSRESKE